MAWTDGIGNFLTIAGQGLRDYAMFNQAEDERKRQLRLQGIYNEEDVATQVPETRSFEVPQNGAALASKIAIPEDPALPGSAVTLGVQQSMPAKTVAPTGRTRTELPSDAVSIGGGEVFVPSRSLAGIAAEQAFNKQRQLSEWEAQQALEREKTVFGWSREREDQEYARQNRGNYEAGIGAGVISGAFDPKLDYSGVGDLINRDTQLRVAEMYSSRQGGGGTPRPRVPATFDEYLLDRMGELAEPTKAIDGSVIWDPDIVRKVRLQAAQEWLSAHPNDAAATSILQTSQAEVAPEKEEGPGFGDRLRNLIFGEDASNPPPARPAPTGRPMPDTSSMAVRSDTQFGLPNQLSPQQWANEAAKLRAQGKSGAEILQMLGTPPTR